MLTSLSPPRLVRADVLIEGDRVAGLGTAPAPTGAAGPAAIPDRVPDRRDCSGCLIMPGLVCAHHHLYSSLARGMPYTLDRPEDFLQILQRVWWRLDRALDEGTAWASAVVGGATALLSGTTTVVDHHASPNWIDGSLDTIASALADLGVRSILCYEVSDRDGPSSAEAGLEENRRFLKSDWPMARGMVGGHASFTLSEETLAACVDLARSEGAGFHIHVAEDAIDQRDAAARFGTSVVGRLTQAGTLDQKALLAHCVHVEDAELEAIRGSGATAVHNARSNMNNAVGRAPISQFQRLALGTDGIGGDMFAEGRAAYWRAREDDSSISPGWVVDRAAESARYAGLIFGEPGLGRIEAGAPADLVVLAYDSPTPLGDDNLAQHWVFGLSSRHVRDVMVGGEWGVLDRRLTRVDAAELTVRCRTAAGRLWERLAEIGPHPFTPRGVA